MPSFKPDWFALLDEEPDMMATFITADTAETTKSYNDATAFSFWGLYEIEYAGRKTGELGLHWLDCVELRVEPKDLEAEFIDFYTECVRHPRPPKIAAIEKKSTGVTLVNILKDKIRGIQIRNIERTRASGSKCERFLQIQPYIAGRQVSFTKGAKHVDMCITHMTKITANDTHRHDDIGDTLSDAVRIALIDKSLYSVQSSTEDLQRKEALADMRTKLMRKSRLRG